LSDFFQKLAGSLPAHLPIHLAGCPAFQKLQLPLRQGRQHFQGCRLQSGWPDGLPLSYHLKGPHRRGVVYCAGSLPAVWYAEEISGLEMFYLVPAFSSFLINCFVSGHPIPVTEEDLVSEKRDVCI